MNTPGKTMTFLSTDIEGSSRLWEQFPEMMSLALARHEELLRQSVEAQHGVVFKTVGDGIYAAFESAPKALIAALAAQKAICSKALPIPLKVRMALHTGTAEQRGGDYFGATLNRVSRLLESAHGGHTLLSGVTHELICDSLPPHTTLRYLGEVRLRDLTQTEHVYQILHPDLSTDFPPLKSLTNTVPSNNLPQQVTSLIGRKKESVEVARSLQNSRMVTLIGSGGCGKTRLALQVAVDLLGDYPDGIWFVELAPLADSAIIPQTVAHVLNVQEEAEKPLWQTLAERLKSKKMVLVLDNCEHLLPAVASLADTLLRALPQIRILATSREPLMISGETIYRVPSLSLPGSNPALTPQNLLQFESVQLFVDRASALSPPFVVTDANASALTAICLRLDGIPLALELAAARSRSLPLEQIAARLDDCFHLLTGGSRAALPRQQTLRALIDWSFYLLSENEQDLFCRLSVFSGGWTLEAAEAICNGGSHEPWKFLDLMTSLADKSLIVYVEQNGTARYRLLETMRQYAAERLRERSGTEALRVSHRNYYLTLAQQSLPQGKDALNNLTLLETEHDNLRTALAASFGDPESVEQMLESLRPISVFRRIRGYYREDKASLQAALAAGAKGRTAARASATSSAASVNLVLGNYEEARQQSKECVAIQRELEEPLKLADALMHYGNLLIETGDFPVGRQVLEEGLEIHLAHGGSGIGFYGNLGNALIYLGEYEQAEKMMTQHLDLCRQSEMQEWEAVGLYNLGRIALVRADYEATYAYFMQSLNIRRELNDLPGLLYDFLGVSFLAVALHQYEHASVLLGAYDGLSEQIGSRVLPADQLEYSRHCSTLRSKMGGEAFTAAYNTGRTLDWEQAMALTAEDLADSLSVSQICATDAGFALEAASH